MTIHICNNPYITIHKINFVQLKEDGIFFDLIKVPGGKADTDQFDVGKISVWCIKRV